ncbi:nucleotidyltransferase family protein [Sphingobacterium spiritivorum]|uniref:nucleotidyltransferase family protein n=1 Tax=Sphingobacterium spiritivorum TaxID=258 RepID=UPI0036BF0AE8
MIKDKVTAVFFKLLRSGLWNTPIDENNSLLLSDEEWEALFVLCVNQTVEAIVFDALERLNPSFLPPKHILLKWVVRVEKIVQRNMVMNSVINEQIALFEKSGIHAVLLKGQGLATLYENPDSRTCGDIDWYFSNEKEYTIACKLIRDMQLEISQTAGYSACYVWKGIETDHHQRIFDIYNPFCRSFLKKLEKNEYKNNIHVRAKDSTWTLPAPVLNILQVNTHILKHQLSFGIGLRQLCDAARLYYVHHHYLDGAYLKKVYTKVGIIRWIYLLHDILHRYIGLPKDYLPFDTLPGYPADWMMTDMLRSGNFGFHDHKFRTDNDQQTFRKSKTQKIAGNFFKYLRYAPMEAISFPLVQLYSGWRIK